MIRVRVSKKELAELIDAHDAKWRARAVAKTKEAVSKSRVDDGIWSAVKAVYILLQQYKCIYCEQPMAKIESGDTRGIGVDYDVEHFRPKNRVTPWPSAKIVARRGIDYAEEVNAGHPAGYVHLAFEPENYVVSCKLCNSFYKGDRFPIGGTPDKRRVGREALDAKEKPFLLFPFGDDGDDPLPFFTFRGAVIAPRPKKNPRRLRARVVIDFFELDTREDLLEGRCLMITTLYPQLERRTSRSATVRERAERFVDKVLSQDPPSEFPHLACARELVALYEADPAAARRWRELAYRYLTEKDPSTFAALS